MQKRSHRIMIFSWSFQYVYLIVFQAMCDYIALDYYELSKCGGMEWMCVNVNMHTKRMMPKHFADHAFFVVRHIVSKLCKYHTLERHIYSAATYDRVIEFSSIFDCMLLCERVDIIVTHQYLIIFYFYLNEFSTIQNIWFLFTLFSFRASE